MIAAENAEALVCHGIWLWATACCSAAAVRQMAEKQSTELITEALVSSRSYLWPCIRFVLYDQIFLVWCIQIVRELIFAGALPEEYSPLEIRREFIPGVRGVARGSVCGARSDGTGGSHITGRR